MGRRDNTSTNNQSYIPGTDLLTIMEPRVKSEHCWSVPKRKGEEKKGKEGKEGEGEDFRGGKVNGVKGRRGEGKGEKRRGK